MEEKMSHVTLYFDRKTEALVRQAVKGSGLSLSKWIASQVTQKIRCAWPEQVRSLAGAWTDFPSAEELRRQAGKDTKRESL
jgi:hypothetical protein